MSHREKLTLLGLALGVCISNGFARFAYGLLLPAMQADLDWRYAEAGWINTANALGYVLGAILTFALIGRVSPSRLFSYGLIGTTVSLLATGLSSDIGTLSFWRIAAGAFGAPVFISGSALAASMFIENPARNALAIALYFGGGGIGMVMSGALLPGLLAQSSTSWPSGWITMGIASVLLCPLSLWAAAQFSRIELNKPPQACRLPLTGMLAALSAYTLFACGYIVYLTFLVAAMRTAAEDPVKVSLVWVTLGLAVIISPFVWNPVLSRWSNGIPLALAIGATAVGSVLPLFADSLAVILLSAIIFGLAVFIAPGAVTAFSRRNLPQPAWGRAVAVFTLLFAIGQTIGPVVAGILGDFYGDIRSALLGAGLVLALGTLIALMQRTLTAESL